MDGKKDSIIQGNAPCAQMAGKSDVHSACRQCCGAAEDGHDSQANTFRQFAILASAFHNRPASIFKPAAVLITIERRRPFELKSLTD